LTGSHGSTRLAVTAAALTLGAATGWLPWLRSGRRDYDAFALARAARDLGLAEGAARHVLVVLVFSLPAIAGGAWLAWSLRLRRVVAGLAGAGGVVLLVAAGVAWRAHLAARWGLLCGAVAGSLCLLLAVLAFRGDQR